MNIMNDEELKHELIHLRLFYKVFSNYFQYWWCPVCEVQFEHEISLNTQVCPICKTPSIPWIAQAAKEAKIEAKKYEEKYNESTLEKEKYFRTFIGIRNICGDFGYVESEETIPHFIRRKLEEYEGLLDALPSELRILLNNGKAKENEQTMANISSPHASDGGSTSK